MSREGLVGFWVKGTVRVPRVRRPVFWRWGGGVGKGRVETPLMMRLEGAALMVWPFIVTTGPPMVSVWVPSVSRLGLAVFWVKGKVRLPMVIVPDRIGDGGGVMLGAGRERGIVERPLTMILEGLALRIWPLMVTGGPPNVRICEPTVMRLVAAGFFTAVKIWFPTVMMACGGGVMFGFGDERAIVEAPLTIMFDGLALRV